MSILHRKNDTPATPIGIVQTWGTDKQVSAFIEDIWPVNWTKEAFDHYVGSDDEKKTYFPLPSVGACINAAGVTYARNSDGTPDLGLFTLPGKGECDSGVHFEDTSDEWRGALSEADAEVCRKVTEGGAS